MRIDAPGYATAVSRAFKPEEGRQVLDFALRRATGITGIVCLPNGKPAAGADVGLSTWQTQVRLRFGKFDPNANFPKTSTGLRRPILVPTALGQVRGGGPDRHWLRRGHVRRACQIGQARAASLGTDRRRCAYRRPVRAEPSRSCSIRSGPSVKAAWRVSALATGRKPTSGAASSSTAWSLARALSPGLSETTPVPDTPSAQLKCWPERIEVKPGETAQVTLGGKGRPVIGRIVLDGTPEVPIDWTLNLPVMLGVPPEKSDPNRFGLLAWGSTLFAAHINKDGRFRIDDVPAGKYELELEVGEDPRPIGRVKQSVVVPAFAGDRSDEPFDLGTIAVKVDDGIKIGDLAPDFDVECIGTDKKGQHLKLSDYRGKLVLLNFWQAQAGRQNDMTVLKEVQASFGRDPRFVLISLACGEQCRAGRAVDQARWAELDARLRRRLRHRRRHSLQHPRDSPVSVHHWSRSKVQANPADVPDRSRRANRGPRHERKRSRGRGQGDSRTPSSSPLAAEQEPTNLPWCQKKRSPRE